MKIALNPKIVASTDKYVVLDDILTPEIWPEVLRSVHNEMLSPAWILNEYDKLWRVDGPLPASSKSYLHSEGPYQNYPWVMAEVFLGLAKTIPDLVAPGWKDLRIHAHVCQRGTKISWHLDSHGHCAFTYYAHEYWGSTWGGEQLIAEVPKMRDRPPKRYDDAWEDGYLAKGFGTYIAPRPNRCVITAPGVWHAVNRVDPDAGNATRISIVGFLLGKSGTKEPTAKM